MIALWAPDEGIAGVEDQLHAAAVCGVETQVRNSFPGFHIDSFRSSSP
jgi:hypothetical protein